MVRDISISPGELPEPPAGTEPERIYHYTDAGGLLGIVEKKCLRASDVWFMNDAREATYGLKVIKRVLKAREPAPGTESEVYSKTAGLIAGLEDPDDVVRSYIACLSKKGDQLSQWRAYGRPRGFSIGFDRQQLRSFRPLGPQLGKPIYRNVAYERTTQDNMVTGLFRTRVNLLPAHPTDGDLDGAAWIFVLEALLLVPAFKHRAFKEEKEVRLQIFHDPKAGIPDDLKFRAGAMGVVPYVEIPLQDPVTDKMTVIREVIVGPQPNQTESERAVRQLLARCGIEGVEVRPSKIPLRS